MSDRHALLSQLRSALSALCLVLESCGDREGDQRIRAYVEGRYELTPKPPVRV